jgi:hypothetical protein
MSYRTLLGLAAACLLPLLADATQTQIVPLSGMGEPGEQPVLWDFRIDNGRGAGQWTRIRVPSCWEQEGFGTYYYGTQGRNKPDDDPIIPKERGDYRTEFMVPAEWRGQQVRIVFEAAMTDTTVRVNGQPAGPTHQGGFYRFHYDISSLVKFGTRNLLEVSVSKESANTSVNRAERRGDYWTFGGIYRPVWLEARPRDHIEWTAIDARADGSFYAQVHLENKVPSDRSVRGVILDEQGNRVGPPLIASLDSHGTTAIVTGRVTDPRLWSAETPNLYRAQFALLTKNEEVVHTVTERFGFRTFELRPRDGLYLNGRKIVLKGINRHSFAPATGRTISREQSYQDARVIKEANMNAVRMSHYPPDPHFLQAADELGLYVLDELAGWQGSYDTPTGSRLIGQIVRRDVNHPSILFWDNGNEGGWNREVDGEFDRWDPQRRPVLHPWAIHSGVNTDHYESYESTVKLSNGPDIFMPTEFLHGLYDGGIGAGLRDYWDVMGNSPTVGGGFFWVFADEGIERTDRNGRIDNMGNSAPDGIVGPHGEKEGSYFSVKEIWSPVQINALRVDRARSSLRMTLSNRYSFTELSEVKFRWRALQLPPPGGMLADQRVIANGEVDGPALAPGASGEWEIPLQRSTEDVDTFELTAFDSNGHDLWTWTARGDAQPAVAEKSTVRATKKDQGIVESPPYELRFDTSTGQLIEIRKDGHALYLRYGPRLVAYKRNGRNFEDIAAAPRLRRLDLAPSSNVLATVTYDGSLRKVTWSRSGNALILSYEFQFEYAADVLGIGFDFREEEVTSKRWVGKGPYRVWQNRREGGVFGFHETAYNDPIPGETYAYPEFKGYFDAWRWLTLSSSNQSVTVENISGVPCFGLYQPKGGVNPVLDLPDVGWSFLHVIPAIGTKFDLPEKMGPQSQTRTLRGIQRGELRFDFETLSERAESATH